jgi:hypothetical protein
MRKENIKDKVKQAKLENCEHKKIASGWDVAQWLRASLVCTMPWVPSPTLQKYK